MKYERGYITYKINGFPNKTVNCVAQKGKLNDFFTIVIDTPHECQYSEFKTNIDEDDEESGEVLYRLFDN